jgi:hypothetical protein
MVLSSSILPEIVATQLPASFFIPAIVTTVVLFLTGLLMLRRQTLERRRLAHTRASPTPRRGAQVFDRTPLESGGVAS